MLMHNRYNSSTGEFTVPSGGAGLYFLYVNFWVIGGKWVRFYVKLNNSDVCKAEIDTRATGSTADRYHAASGALTILTEGMSKEVTDEFYGTYHHFEGGGSKTQFVTEVGVGCELVNATEFSQMV